MLEEQTVSDFDLSFSGRIDDSKFYDFNQQHLEDELGTTTGFASAHRDDQIVHEPARLDDTDRFAPALL